MAVLSSTDQATASAGPEWDWRASNVIAAADITDAGDGDAGGDAFDAISRANGVVHARVGSSAHSALQIATVADDEAGVWAIELAPQFAEDDYSSSAHNLLIGLVFALQSGGSPSLASDSYRGAGWRIGSNYSQARYHGISGASWLADATLGAGGSNNSAGPHAFILQRTASGDLAGYTWHRGGALHEVFTHSNFGTGAGRILARVENLNADTGEGVSVIAARASGLTISADATHLIVA
jgi:hypothetical protein